MAPKHEWLIILPDYAGAYDKRMEVRPKHLENIKPDVKDGVVVMGGATLDEPVQDGQAPKINGSAMLVLADSREEAMAWVEKDIYYKSKVWDTSKVQIYPFKSAVRTAL